MAFRRRLDDDDQLLSDRVGAEHACFSCAFLIPLGLLCVAIMSRAKLTQQFGSLFSVAIGISILVPEPTCVTVLLNAGYNSVCNGSGGLRALQVQELPGDVYIAFCAFDLTQ